MESKPFTKLSALVDDEFTVEKVWGYKFKMWDVGSSKMLTSDTWQKGYQKRWDVDTDKGKLDISATQLGNMLEGVCHSGAADINGCTFSVKSNGKTGMEIRYWLSPVRTQKVEDANEQGDDGFGGW